MNTILCHLVFFLARNWESFVVNILASGAVAFFVVKIFRIPSFNLHLDYIRGKKIPMGFTRSVLDISLMNKKRFLGYSADEVNFGLFIPCDFIKEKKLFLITPEGQKEWRVPVEGKTVFILGDKGHYQYRGMVRIPIYPFSRTHFLRVTGDFEKDKEVKIYYYVNTIYGKFPYFLRFGEIQKNAESQNLPFTEIHIN